MGTEFAFAGFAIKVFLNSAEADGVLNEAKRDLKKIIDAPPTVEPADDGLNDLKKAFGVR